MRETFKILIVDNDRDLRATTVQFLRQTDYAIYEAASAGEAMTAMRSIRPNLVLLDVVLPDRSGLHLCRDIKADPELSGTFVMLISSTKTSSDDQAEGFESGADGYMVRPMEKRELLARIENLARIRKLAQKPGPQIPRNYRIMIVGDDEVLMGMYARLLRSASYDVMELSTGQECLDRVEAYRPDLILLDIMLPDLDALEVCRRIKTSPNPCHSYVVLFSVLETSDHQAQGLEDGADAYIARPISSRELLARVKALLRIKEVEKKLRRREHQQAALAELGEYALAERDISAILRKSAELVVDALGVEDCSFLRIPPGDVDSPPQGIERPCWNNDLLYHPPPSLMRLGLVNSISVVVRGREKAYALLSVHANQHRTFTENDMLFVKSVASMLATAIERSRVENALRTSQEKYLQIFEAAPVSLWEEDYSAVKAFLDQLRDRGIEDIPTYIEENPRLVEEVIGRIRILNVNGASLRLYGAGSETELTGSLGKVFRPATLKMFREQLVAMSEGKTSFEAETENVTLQGERIDILLKLQVLGDPSRLERVLTSHTDITGRKRAEEALKQAHLELERKIENRTRELLASNNRLREEVSRREQAEVEVRRNRELLQALLDAVPESLFLMDVNGIILAANEAVMLRLSKEGNELIGFCVYDLLDPDVAAGRKAKVKEAIRKRRPVRFEDVRSGRNIDHWVSPIIDHEGQISLLAIFSHDITDRKRLEADPAECEKLP